MVPADGCARPAIRRSSVDLPEPVRPSSPTIWPCAQLEIDAVEHQMLAAVGSRERLAQRRECRAARRSLMASSSAQPEFAFGVEYSGRQNTRLMTTTNRLITAMPSTMRWKSPASVCCAI